MDERRAPWADGFQFHPFATDMRKQPVWVKDTEGEAWMGVPDGQFYDVLPLSTLLIDIYFEAGDKSYSFVTLPDEAARIQAEAERAAPTIVFHDIDGTRTVVDMRGVTRVRFAQNLVGTK